MTPDQSKLSPKTEQDAPVHLSAYELHKALVKLFLHNGSHLSETMTSQEINRLLKEYAYRGRDVRYIQYTN